MIRDSVGLYVLQALSSYNYCFLSLRGYMFYTCLECLCCSRTMSCLPSFLFSRVGRTRTSMQVVCCDTITSYINPEGRVGREEETRKKKQVSNRETDKQTNWRRVCVKYKWVILSPAFRPCVFFSILWLHTIRHIWHSIQWNETTVLFFDLHALVFLFVWLVLGNKYDFCCNTHLWTSLLNG